jgi:hypothetical protein
MRTQHLLAGGIVAGPLFLATSLTQAFTRDGFDLRRHPISLLSLGEFGWIQVANFVVCSAAFIAGSVGLRRRLSSGRGRTWAPRLVALVGAGLVTAGVFVTDAGAGFPAGAPAGAPERISVHGIVHEVGFLAVFAAVIALCVVLARRFAAERRWGWLAACVATPVVAIAITAWPNLDTLSVRLVLSTAVQFGFLSSVLGRLSRDGVSRGTAGPRRTRAGRSDRPAPAGTPAG